MITQYLNFNESTANQLYGYAQGVLAAGAISGGLFAGLFAKNLKAAISPFLIIGCALSVFTGGIALQILDWSPGIYLILVIGSGLLIGFSTVFQIQMLTYLQILTPKDLVGKVISCFICICMCTSPLGQFIYGFIFEKTGNIIYIPFYAAALIILVIAFFTRHIFYNMDNLIKEEVKPDPYS